MKPTDFDYVNLGPRGRTPLIRALRVVSPGIREVSAQTRPYADWWRARNLETLAADGPLWVVLGDSLSQGIGTSRVENGWVPRVAAQLHAEGLRVRVLNLSFSGARTDELIDLQLPVLQQLGIEPAAVSVMVGSNDLMRPSVRKAQPETYARMLDAVPEGALVTTTPTGGLAHLTAMVNAHPRVHAVPHTFAAGELAADRFHPDDRGYARLAGSMVGAVAARLAGAEAQPAQATAADYA